MVYKNLCILVLWTKVASALEGLKLVNISLIIMCYKFTAYLNTERFRDTSLA